MFHHLLMDAVDYLLSYSLLSSKNLHFAVDSYHLYKQESLRVVKHRDRLLTKVVGSIFEDRYSQLD